MSELSEPNSHRTHVVVVGGGYAGTMAANHLRLRAALADLDPSAAVTVVGGGLTGIEAAGELAEQGRSVTLVCGGILGPSLSGPGRRSVAKQLRKLGVTVLEAVAVSEVRWDSV